MKKYDAIVIGSGQAGAPLAKKLAAAGMKTVIIEKRFYGGTCVNDGCTPTKTWVASAKAAYMAGKSAELGVPVKKFSVNMPKIKKRKDEIVMRSRIGGQHAAEKTKGLDVVFGEAVFTGEKAVTVILKNGKKANMQADLVFLNTGCLPLIPEIEGLNEIQYLNSTTILDLDYVPEHLLVLGGNYIGLEFGQMFRRFGSKVTILEKSARIVAKEDEDISAEMQTILEAESIKVLTNAQATKFKQKPGSKITATVTVNGEEKKIKCSHVLVAVGRAPQTKTLGLDKAGIKTDDRGFITVNTKLETSAKGVYALGDVKGGPAFTHISYNDYTIVYRNIVEKQKLNTNDRPLPYCMFTDPQLGRIGISEAEAKKQGLDYKVAKLPMAHVARAIENGDTRGFMKAIVDTKTKKILGAAVLGPEGGEIMTVLQMAMEGGITYDRIRYCVFAHPLYSESLNNLFMSLED
ncbi:Pyruvate/2-oxoglutarate dehydrogenase complex, dihydrolipoamide dehydrogenase (E3) component [Mucilaginibacter pineti]|uniref:Pyruvate/2-oxoglutarate dehydrogenase complex, dihydrolipoamide dehydrogenase (E3) component n=1 Tax=Mucilaginibacter pineti TaxID=1391627 RepID=A0A1G7H184_9SPHI|nr:mercuric reductase [Mucilaginibacter pineti]SDE94190.1 Pyruvate/2-oxoglutarate dehydrogenase complex, dihydrolipoamide dehydrogenase (E3) component [Mucilaginibacter pineti]